MRLDENKIWVDGCFDFMHHGHCGALLQARRAASNPTQSQLLVGIHTDEQITINKGPPVMHTLERYAHARALRWCTQVIENAPYVTQPEWLDKYGCVYVVHGDDITTDANGEDCYQEMKDLNRFKMVKRTYGVSTTDIIQRILTGENNHESYKINGLYYPTIKELSFYSHGINGIDNYCNVWEKSFKNYLVKGLEINDFNSCVLVMGVFDLFHIGHIEQLHNIHDKYPDCKIIISLMEPQDRNKEFCIMTLKERALSILSCKYVDGLILTPSDDLDAFRKMFKYVTYIDNPDFISGTGSFSQYLNKQVIIDRIQEQRNLYVARNKSKGMVIT